MTIDPSILHVAPAVADAVSCGAPVVALETAVLTHGLPAPHHLNVVRAMERAVREAGALPATIGILDGQPIIGLSDSELIQLSNSRAAVKASPRDLAVILATRRSAGTTVATTTLLAAAAGITVFATGGIGGVHRQANLTFDISADLPVLATTPIVVVCAGGKSILDLPATVEWLETAGVPIIGYATDELPGFFVRQTGLRLAARADTPAEIASLLASQRALGLRQALLVTVPPPEATALPADQVEIWLAAAIAEANQCGVSGRDLTPFLLRQLVERSNGMTLQSNLALLQNNAGVGGAIARAVADATGAPTNRSSPRPAGSMTAAGQ